RPHTVTAAITAAAAFFIVFFITFFSLLYIFLQLRYLIFTALPAFSQVEHLILSLNASRLSGDVSFATSSALWQAIFAIFSQFLNTLHNLYVRITLK
ncbi:MAG: hypothetical protein PUG45_12525, partial [bacterium]|nr:hypothetical protein [bacterium]